MIEVPTIQARVAEAMARLVRTTSIGESIVVSLPIVYPSGAFVGISISVSRDKCFVSDTAIGFREAEMAGASDFCDWAANRAAESFYK